MNSFNNHLQPPFQTASSMLKILDSNSNLNLVGLNDDGGGEEIRNEEDQEDDNRSNHSNSSSIAMGRHRQDAQLDGGEDSSASSSASSSSSGDSCNLIDSRNINEDDKRVINGGSPVMVADQQNQQKDFDEVKQVELFGVSIVALTINAKERLCLAQISNTLLKEFSYNEIHNRRVALGITCVQCTPIQLEMLRRAGAMPSSSRRCGMITRREAERLCRSFLVEEQPPELPENFHFAIAHRVNYGCKGRFIPARYISSRAKCIECFYCGEFYSPNKFIFHSHRQPNATDCNPPDSPNINSWRKHIDLDWTQEHSQEIKYAWEDVKSLFNGGTRRRAPISISASNNSAASHWQASNDGHQSGGSSPRANSINLTAKGSGNNSSSPVKIKLDEEQLIDVEFDDGLTKIASNPQESIKRSANSHNKLWPAGASLQQSSRGSRSHFGANYQQQVSGKSHTSGTKRSMMSAACSSQANKRFSHGPNGSNQKQASSAARHQVQPNNSANNFQRLSPQSNRQFMPPTQTTGIPFCDFLGAPNRRIPNAAMGSNNQPAVPISDKSTSMQPPPPQQHLSSHHLGYNSPSSAATSAPSFIYSQLYTQLMQSNQQQPPQPSKQLNKAASVIDHAQLALRHHIWSSLLANLQAGGVNSNQNYNGNLALLTPQQLNEVTSSMAGQPVKLPDRPHHGNHHHQSYHNHLLATNPIDSGAHSSFKPQAFSMQKPYSSGATGGNGGAGEANDI